MSARQNDYEIRIFSDFNMREGLTNSIVHQSSDFLFRFEVAFRKRFNNDFNEARYNLTFAKKINKDFTLLIQDGAIYNIYPNSKMPSNDNSYDNFHFNHEANNLSTISILYHLNKESAISFGYIRRIAGGSINHDNFGFTSGLFAAF